MENSPDADIFETTRLLKAWGEGDETALERLVPQGLRTERARTWWRWTTR